jgi:hypothetical protein
MPGGIGITWWHGVVALDRRAAQRYVKNCGLAGAERVLIEWFGEKAKGALQTPPAAAPTAPEPPRKHQRKRPRNAKRWEIAGALASLVGSTDWEAASDKQRCRLVDSHLNKSKGWCKPTTLRRAVDDYKTT